MTTPAQRLNLSELLVALRGIKDSKGNSPLSPDLESLLDNGLHHQHLPNALQPSAAEAFQLAFEAWGGVPRLLLFADRYPGAFLKLYARQTAQTMQPVIPAPKETEQVNDWPEWMDAQRLAYRLPSPEPEGVSSDPHSNPEDEE